MANKYDISVQSGSLRITHKWRTGVAWFFLFFTVFWNLIVLIALLSGAGIFVIFHLLAGIGVGWMTLAKFFNTTTIEANSRTLSIKHGPIPWMFRTDKEIEARSLVQLYVEKSSVKINNQPTYNLRAKTDQGKNVKLMGANQDRDLLLRIEHAIEAHLGIMDDPTLGYKDGAEERLNLEELAEHLEMLEPIKNWLPKSMREGLENAQRKAMARHEASGGSPFSPPNPAPATSPEIPKTPPIYRPGDGPRPLDAAANPATYPLYTADSGSEFTFAGRPYRVTRTAQTDFALGAGSSRQLEVTPTGGGVSRYLYAEQERGRWAYYEERRLDNAEAEQLGFTNQGERYPLKLENGDDRYYPRNERRGRRFVGTRSDDVRQFVYTTTGASTQFRALQPVGGPWEVFVQEVVDAGSFEG